MGNLFSKSNVGEDDIDGYRNEHVKYYLDEVKTGDRDYELEKILETLKKKMNDYCEEATVEYIGKASGEDPMSALKSRVDKTKRRLRINKMRLLYETENEDNAFTVEDALVSYSTRNHADKNENKRAGGGGRKSNAPKHYVYAAYA